MAAEAKRRILVAVDGSKQALSAFNWFVDNCYRDGDFANVVSVVDMQQHIKMPFFPASLDDKAVLEISKQAKEAQDTIDQMLNKFSDIMRQKKIKGSSKAISGNKPAEEICKCAAEENIQMIVIGTRGLSTVRRTVLGSVSDFVVHHAHVPVVVVPYSGTQEEGCQRMET